MRWFWIDRFTEFERGRRAVAVKNVSLVEEQIDDYLPGFPIMPASMIIEGLAQTGGLLVSEYGGFTDRVVLAKINSARFHELAVPGDTLTYTATIETRQTDGAIVRGTSHLQGRLQAEVEMVFAHLGERYEGFDLFHPDKLLCMMRLLGMYDVGRDENGQPIDPPAYMLEAERVANLPGHRDAGGVDNRAPTGSKNSQPAT